jgi:hypothetical protein
VATSRIELETRGETQPMASGSSEGAMTQNRRDAFRILLVSDNKYPKQRGRVIRPRREAGPGAEDRARLFIRQRAAMDQGGVVPFVRA